MTQLDLTASLATRIRAWAGEPRSFADLCDAFPAESATDLDTAAREAGVLQWAADIGFYVAAPLDVKAP
jgi:hypothetical protein